MLPPVSAQVKHSSVLHLYQAARPYPTLASASHSARMTPFRTYRAISHQGATP